MQSISEYPPTSQLEKTNELLSALHRGGKFAYWWTAPAKVTTWWPVGKPAAIPTAGNVYFGIHPTSKAKGKWERALIEDITVVNCLFAEFDAKDYGSKEAAYEHIIELQLPTVLVDSGGGYHAYWILSEPYQIHNATDLETMRDIQSRWVNFVGGDPGAKDLARVLRVPGTLNLKYDPPRQVEFLFADFDLTYDLNELVEQMPVQPEPTTAPAPDNRPVWNGERKGDKWLTEAVGKARPGNRNETGFWLAQQCRDDGLTKGETDAILRAYVARVPQPPGDPYTEGDARSTVLSVFTRPAREPARSRNGSHSMQSSNIGAGIVNPEGYQDAPPGAWGDDLPPMPEEPPETDDFDFRQALAKDETGDAGIVAKVGKDQIIYDHALKEWFLWAGHYWQPDKTGQVLGIVSNTVAAKYLRAAADALEVKDNDFAKDLSKRSRALGGRRRIDNVLYLAARQNGLGITGNEWDSDPWLLGCANGVIDLRTGSIRKGHPDDFILAHSPIEWLGIDTPAPRFEAFLREIFEGKPELPPFMGRLMGYAVTGLTLERILAILQGEGANGKTVLLEAMGDTLGADLATSSQADALMDSANGSGPQPFVFALRGKRLVWASESSEGKRINAGLVKQLTGGDRLNVRTLHSKPVEFTPTHQLFLLTNHKPHISADDQAVWDRVFLVPFSYRFVDNPVAGNERKRDARLREKLRAEAPGILAWLVRGALEWQRIGLQPPAEVLTATAEYRAEEDTVSQFIDEALVIHPDAKVKGNSLYKAYDTWCKDNGIPPMSNTAFGRRMKKRFTAKVSGGVWYMGVGLAAIL